ncbi:MAG TPA: GAF domain-containing protein [Candidatus Eisenbacteria bacterium]|nr:GAF domain-containing protein [Candidatus Eisenbacteria bacterium]
MRLAFLDLPDDRVDLVPKARQTPDVDVVLVAHADADALALRIAEMLQLPRSTEPLDLLPLKPDLIALPSLDSPSAAMLLKAGFSPGIFVTLEALIARLERPVRPGAVAGPTNGAPAPAAFDATPDATGDPTPIQEWEVSFDQLTGTRLGQIRDALALTDDRKRLFRELLSLAVDQTGGDAGSIMLVDEEAGELRIAFADGLSSDVVRTMRQPLGEGVAGKVALDGRPVLLHDRIDDPRFRDGRERSRISAAMCVPLKLDGRIIGVLNVSSGQAAKRFDEGDLARLVEIAGQISSILERVVERTKRDLQATEYRARQAMEDAFATAPADRASRFRAVARGLVAPLEAASVTLYLAEPGARRFAVVSSNAAAGPDGTLPAATAGFIAKVHHDGDPLFLGDRLGRGATPNLVAAAIGGQVRHGVLAAENVQVTADDAEPFARLMVRLGEQLGRLVEAHRAEDAIARQGVVFGKLADVAPRLMMSRDVEFLCSEAAGALRQLQPRAYVVARLIGRDGAVLERNGFDGTERDRDAAAERESLLSAAVLSEGSERSSVSGEEGEPAHAIVPIRLGERVLGTLSVVLPESASVERFGSALDGVDLEALRKVALYVSLAWEQSVRGANDTRPAEDPVTGLLGSAGLEARVQEEVKRAERYHDRFLLTLCSISGFDDLEAAHGTDWAQSLLRQFAEALAHNVREVDAVARLGGGRFAVLSPETDKDSGALLRRLDHLVPRLDCVRGLRNPDDVRLEGRQFTYPDEVPTGGELLELLRRERSH